MNFATAAQHRRFLDLCPEIEQYIVDGGITLIKIWLEVGKEEQERRFLARINDPLRQWKLSPMDLESYKRWYEYSTARDLMLEATDSKHAPWHIVWTDDKRRGRLNCISQILSLIPIKSCRKQRSNYQSSLQKISMTTRHRLSSGGALRQKNIKRFS
jgi:polyphosphate kinase